MTEGKGGKESSMHEKTSENQMMVSSTMTDRGELDLYEADDRAFILDTLQGPWDTGVGSEKN